MKKFITFTVALLCMVGINSVSAAQKSDKKIETATYSADIHCQSCAAKVMKVIPYEKGVKDVKVDQAKRTVKVKYDGAKTTDKQILKAFDKIKMDAKIVKK